MFKYWTERKKGAVEKTMKGGVGAVGGVGGKEEQEEKGVLMRL